MLLKEVVVILLVEDDPEDRDLTMRSISDAHICNQVHVVEDGEEALDYLFCTGRYATRDKDAHPRLVLLDLKLPKINGLEVLEQMKADPRTQAIPVVILTSSKQESDMVKSYKLGANSYIQKPVDFEQFESVIKQIGYYWILVNQPPPDVAFEMDVCNESVSQ
jgi:CheY-like chemotaxis protein